ncbi:MAG: WD40 repeat domain-containing protein [Phycisphaerae bacterium]
MDQFRRLILTLGTAALVVQAGAVAAPDSPAKEVKHLADATCVTFSPDGRLVVSGGYDQMVRFWSLPGWKEAGTLRSAKNVVGAVEFSPDGEVLAVGCGPVLKLVDVKSRKEIRRSVGHKNFISDIEFSPDGKRIYTSGYFDQVVRVWDADRLKTLGRTEKSGQIGSIAVSADAKMLVAVNDDGRVRSWPLVKGLPDSRKTSTMEGHEGCVRTCETLHGGSVIASGGNDGTVRLWDPQTRLQMLMIKAHKTPIRALAFSRDELWMVTGSKGGGLAVWELATGKLIHRMPDAHRRGVESAAFSPAGDVLVSTGRNGSVKFWTVADLLQMDLPDSPSESELRDAWVKLASADPADGFKALHVLTRNGQGSVKLLSGRMEPAAEPKELKDMEVLISEVASADDEVSERAVRRLKDLGLAAKDELGKLRENVKMQSAREMILHLMASLSNPVTTDSRELQDIRAVAVLERIATPEARKLLEKLAGGYRHSRLTLASKGALSRLKQRK